MAKAGQYKAKCGAIQFKLKASKAPAMSEANDGWCLACGNEQSGCEPDARRYKCEGCGANKVYGAEELVMMGLVY